MTEQEKTIAMIFDKSVEALGIMTKSLCDAIKSTKTDLQTDRLYTADDMEAFAEWCSENGWNISIKKHRWVNDNGEGIFTKQLRELWE